jgi:hypothetical protein
LIIRPWNGPVLLLEQVQQQAAHPVGTQEVVDAGALQLFALPGDQLVEGLARAVGGDQFDGPHLALELAVQPAPVLDLLGAGRADGLQIGLGVGSAQVDDVGGLCLVLAEHAEGVDQAGVAIGGQVGGAQHLGGVQAGVGRETRP